MRRDFQRIELTLQHRRFHVMSLALAETGAENPGVTGKMNEQYVGGVDPKQDAIAFLESGARENCTLAGGAAFIDFGTDAGEPRRSVTVVEGLALTHLGDVRRRVKIVPFIIGPTEIGGDQPADGGLAGTGDAHDEKNVEGDRQAVGSEFYFST